MGYYVVPCTTRLFPQHCLGPSPTSRSILWGVIIGWARVSTSKHGMTRNIVSSGYWLSPQLPSVGMTGSIGRSSVGEPSRWSLYAANGGGAYGIQDPTNPTGANLTCQKSTWFTACIWSRRGTNPTGLAKSFDYSDVEIYMPPDRDARGRTG